MGKYKRDKGLQIPMEQRQNLNAKILYLVENHETELYGITPEDIFNVYMGNGGLHGLDRKDFQNFHAYTEAKKEIEQGQFFTPAEICEFLVACVKPEPKDIIYDLTYGKGDFFNYLPTESNIYGTEIDMKAVKIAQYLYPKANLQYGDIRQYSPVLSGDIVFGNPPFHLEWGTKEAPVSSQMYYCKKAYQVLKNGGLLVLLVSESFLSDDFSNKGDIEEINHMFNLIVQFSLPADAFKEYGVTSFRTKAMILQKKSQYVTERPYTTELEVLKRPQEIYQTYVLPVLQERRKNAANIYFECQNTDLEAKQKQVFQEKTVKLLFDIKRNRNIAHKAGLAEAILQKYLKQTKPEELSWQEWEKIKIQPEDVLRKLKGILSSANKTYRNEIRIVKTTYGFKEKDYRENGTDMNLGSINSFVLSKREVPGFEQFLKKKRREFALQETSFEKMKQDDKIAEYLENWHVTSQMTGEVKYLNAVQKKEVNKLLQKRYAALQFSMGTGKSLCTLAMAQYRMKYNPVRNIFIVGTALAINNTWEEILEDYQIDFYRIRKREDIKRVQRGQIVLLTINLLTELKREMKKLLRIRCQKVMLIFDESDAITNGSSKRTKAMLSVFRKCRYKVLATGTLTRNNVVEAAPQLELLYNNSIHYLAKNEWIYRFKNGQMEKNRNFFLNQPFPAYKRGYELFSYSYLPKKITVFGLEKANQDIYNASFLDELLEKTVITKNFEEVVGRKIYKIYQGTCSFSEREKEVYRIAVKEFDKIRRKYFAAYGNARKDSMFRILQQLLLLLKICADPSLAYEYDSNEVPTKVKKAIRLLQMWKYEKVAIGVRRIEVADSYYRYLKQAFPERQIFYITGDKVPCKQRQRIVEKLRKTENGILLSTQQSLSESMNIDDVDKIILPELHYNHAAMEQYYFRYRYLKQAFPERQIFYITGDKVPCKQRQRIVEKLRKTENGILLSTQQSLSESMNIDDVDKIILPELHYNHAAMEQYYFRFIRYTSRNFKQVVFLIYENSIEVNLLKMILAKEKLNLFMKNQLLENGELYERFGINPQIFSLLMTTSVDQEGKLQIQWGEQKIS